MNEDITIKKYIIENEMEYKGNVVFKYSIEYPLYYSTTYPEYADILSNTISNKIETLENYYKEVIYRSASKEYDYAQEFGFTFNAFEEMIKFTNTYNSDCIVSSFFDDYSYSGGAHGSTRRIASTYNFKEQNDVKLSDLYDCSSTYTSYILDYIKSNIKKHYSWYYPDAIQIVTKTFNKKSFYCTPTGVVIFFQEYDIAPYVGGIREFLFPYSTCIVNPKSGC